MQAYADQSIELPEWQTFTLQPAPNKLESFEQFEAWNREIEEILQGLKLLGVIDPKLPRPKTKNESGMNWMRVSFQVGEWLKNNIDQDILKELYAYAGKEDVQFADDVYSELRRFMMKQCAYDNFEQFANYRDFKIDEYPDTSNYIKALLELREEMVKTGWSFPPFQALIEILVNIERRHEPITTEHLATLKIQDGNATNFTEQQLQSEVEKLIEEVEAKER